MDNQEYYRFYNNSIFIKLKMFYKKEDNIRLSTKKYISPDVMGECNVFLFVVFGCDVFCFVQLKLYKVSIKYNRMMIKIITSTIQLKVVKHFCYILEGEGRGVK